MSKLVKSNISKLSRSLIIHISKILLGTDESKIDKKMMLSLIFVFRDCRKYYARSDDGLFKLDYYLLLYSKKYSDVMFLANACGLRISNEWRGRYLEYVIPRTRDAARLPKCGTIQKNYPSSPYYNVSIVDSNYWKGASYTYTKIGITSIYFEPWGLVFNGDIGNLYDVNSWNTVVFNEETFPILYKNVNMKMSHAHIELHNVLTIEKFKELVNEKEKREIFVHREMVCKEKLLI